MSNLFTLLFAFASISSLLFSYKMADNSERKSPHLEFTNQYNLGTEYLTESKYEKAIKSDTLEIRSPSGIVEISRDFEVLQLLTINENEGIVTS